MQRRVVQTFFMLGDRTATSCRSSSKSIGYHIVNVRFSVQGKMCGGRGVSLFSLTRKNPLNMKKVSSFRDLEVYKLCRQLAKEIFELSKKFPKEETYSLTDQIRRSSRSVGAQIAEAWGKRRYEKHFISKLTDAGGEQLETQHWIDSARMRLHIRERSR